MDNEYFDGDSWQEYCEEYAQNHPIYENGILIGWSYPNGYIKWIDCDTRE